MSIFVISDTHFFHDVIRMAFRKEYTSIDHMNNSIIEKWNTIVKPTDHVYHLGDFAFGTDLNAIEGIIQKLQGRVTLIAGNHDTPVKIALYTKYWKVASYVVDEDGFVFSHAPIHPFLLEEVSKRSSNIQDRYCIHGHLHASSVPDSRYFNANWDVLGETKILNLEEIKRKILTNR